MNTPTIQNLFVSLVLLVGTLANSQVAINSTNPSDGTMLDINATDKGLLIPKVALTANNSLSAIDLAGSTLEESVLVYNTATVTGPNAVEPGFYYWNGIDQWLPIGETKEWKLSGNTVSTSDRLGTINPRPLIFKTNDNDRLRLESTGQLRSIYEGSETNATYSFVDSPGSGMYLRNNNELNLTSNGYRFMSVSDFGSSRQITLNPDNESTMSLQIRGAGNVILSAHPTKRNIDIGSNNNPEYASLKLSHSDKGFLPNRVIISSLSSFAPIVSQPADGLMVWNNGPSASTPGAQPEGMYFWKDLSWRRALTTEDLDHDWYEEGTTNQPDNIDDNIVTNGAVGIGDTSIDASATLELTGNNKGLLVNRVELTNASIAAPVSSPADGLLVYNTNENLSPSGYLNDVRLGFYVWQNGRWVAQKNENRSARFGNAANRTQNLNTTSGTELELFEFNEWNDDSSLFSVTEGPATTRLTVNEDGRFNIHVNVTIIAAAATTNQNLQLETQILVERGGTTLYPGSTISNNYIKNTNGVVTSSVILDETIELQSGDEVYVYVERAGNSGTVRMRPEAGSNFFTIKKIK